MQRSTFHPTLATITQGKVFTIVSPRADAQTTTTGLTSCPAPVATTTSPSRSRSPQLWCKPAGFLLPHAGTGRLTCVPWPTRGSRALRFRQRLGRCGGSLRADEAGILLDRDRKAITHPRRRPAGAERGSVSGVQRRVAEFDWELLRSAAEVNGPPRSPSPSPTTSTRTTRTHAGTTRSSPQPCYSPRKSSEPQALP